MISSFGIHPKFVLTATSNYASSLTAILKSNPQAHIGEIGLDFRNLENDQVKKKQIQMFGEQLQLAIDYQRTASVHVVKAHGECYKIFKKKFKNLGKEDSQV